MIPFHRFSVCWRHAWAAIVLVAAHLFLPQALWAQSQTPGPKVHAATIPYLLVVLCLALALILLCRSSSRSKDVRLEDLDED